LEQRIARAWRKHQTRSVEVINLVCENSIEHRMVSMLSQKQQLADGVLDGRGDLESIKIPSGKTSLIERLETLMGAPPAKTRHLAEDRSELAPATAAEGADAFDRFRQDMLSRLDNRLLGLDSYTQPNGRVSVLAVVDGSIDQVRPLAERLLRETFAGADSFPALELLDRHTFETIQRLTQAGILRVESSRAKALYAAPSIVSPVENERERLRKIAQTLMAETTRRLKLSAHLRAGGFMAEALPSMAEAVELALKALCCLAGNECDSASEPVPLSAVEGLLTDSQLVSAERSPFVKRLRDSITSAGSLTEETASSLLSAAQNFMECAEQTVARRSLS
jgi:hypothetical protein